MYNIVAAKSKGGPKEIGIGSGEGIDRWWPKMKEGSITSMTGR
jgi:hypothetical protein